MGLDKRVAKTNDAIQDALVFLAQSMPLEKITVTALAKTAQISRKTFYDRYSDVNDLVSCLRNNVVSRFEEVFVPPLNCNNKKSHQAIIDFLDFAKENRELISVLKTNDSPYVDLAIKRRAKAFKNYLIESIHYSPEKATSIAPWLITFYFRGLEHLTGVWLFSKNSLDENDMVKLIDLLFYSPIESIKKDDV